MKYLHIILTRSRTCLVPLLITALKCPTKMALLLDFKLTRRLSLSTVIRYVLNCVNVVITLLIRLLAKLAMLVHVTILDSPWLLLILLPLANHKFTPDTVYIDFDPLLRQDTYSLIRCPMKH